MINIRYRYSLYKITTWTKNIGYKVGHKYLFPCKLQEIFTFVSFVSFLDQGHSTGHFPGRAHSEEALSPEMAEEFFPSGLWYSDSEWWFFFLLLEIEEED